MVPLENRLVGLVRQLLGCFLSSSGAKCDSQASAFVHELFICNTKITSYSVSLNTEEQVVPEPEVGGLVAVI